MALEQRIESLKKRHAEINLKVHDEQSRPCPDTLQLHRWKCEKLFLKDEMIRLIGGHRQAA
jgi:hypothetical protein